VNPHTTKKDYTLYVFRIKLVHKPTRRNSENIKIVIEQEEEYRSITFYMGLGIMAQMNGCRMVGMKLNKAVPLFSKEAWNVIGLAKTGYHQRTLCLMVKSARKGKLRIDKLGMSIYPEMPMPFKPRKGDEIQKLYEQALKLDNQKKITLSRNLKDYWQWLQIQLMPKGFRRLKKGAIVAKGDYYWQLDNGGTPHWTTCDVSFSPVKIGSKNYLDSYCVIRKIK